MRTIRVDGMVLEVFELKWTPIEPTRVVESLEFTVRRGSISLLNIANTLEVAFSVGDIVFVGSFRTVYYREDRTHIECRLMGRATPVGEN
jgi:hypothetical protein